VIILHESTAYVRKEYKKLRNRAPGGWTVPRFGPEARAKAEKRPPDFSVGSDFHRSLMRPVRWHRTSTTHQSPDSKLT